MSVIVALGCGLVAGLGVFLVVLGTRRVERAGRGRVRPAVAPAARPWVVRVAAGAGVGLVVALVTGWPVGAVLAGVLAAQVPTLFGGRAARAAELVRAEAIAAWTSQLRDMLVVGSGILETIEVTASLAPRPIRAEVGRLALGLRGGRLAPALAAFAAEVGDPMADLVAAALAQAAAESGGSLGELLTSLAARTRDQAAMRRRIDKEHAPIRTQARWVAVITLVCVVGVFVFDRGILAPYDTAAGQVVLGVIGACFLAAFSLLARMSKVPAPERFVGAQGAGPTGPQSIGAEL